MLLQALGGLAVAIVAGIIMDHFEPKEAKERKKNLNFFLKELRKELDSRESE